MKEERIRAVALSYYSRQDIRQNMMKFAQNRETVPRYFEGFGKRPDALQFESDVFELAKKGATSFHCSEELWKDPMDISTGLTDEQLNVMRKAWDLLIDIDSKYFDYSKIYAEILVKVLRQHGVKNIGVKFSGSKGLHIIVPSKAFPKELSGMQTKDMFPEWPRLICKYLGDKVSLELKEPILKLIRGEKQKAEQLEVYCNKCNSLAEFANKITYVCPSCQTRSESVHRLTGAKRILRCLICSKKIEENQIDKREVSACFACKANSQENPNQFKERIKTQNIDADIVLVSPRHLFRMPYSLHEKTALASVVIDPDKIKDFELPDAHPMKISSPKDFIPDAKEGEATQLLIKAIEHQSIEPMMELDKKQKQSFSKPIGAAKSKDFGEIVIKDLTSELYPPCIKTILAGMKSDGRKRALFILLNFFRSLKVEPEKIQEILEEWNKKNYEPLKSGYIKAQLAWHAKSPARLPPNFDKPHYREIGIVLMPQEIKAKNPVSYVIRRNFALQNSAKRKTRKTKK